MLLEFIENKKIKLNNCIVIETGGMKGNREEIEKKKLMKFYLMGMGLTKFFQSME